MSHGDDLPGTWPAPAWSSRSRRSGPSPPTSGSQAEQPNETWQADFTHYRLTARRPPGADVEILTWLDDHSRYALSVTAHHRVTGPIVLATFRETVAQHGIPASTLTDNGMVFTTRLSGGTTGGRNGFETELRRLGVRPEELPTQPPHHLRQGRTVPADHEELAARPTRPARPPSPSCRPCSTPSSTTTTTTGRTAPCRTAPPPPPPTPPAPRPPPATATADTHDRRPPRPRRHAGKITLRHGGRLYSHRHRPNPRPNPRPRCSSTTSTSASSTPPPANSSATSPSTPPALPSHRHDHPAHHPKTTSPEPTIAGSGVSDVLRHHMVPGGGIRTHTEWCLRPSPLPLGYRGRASQRLADGCPRPDPSRNCLVVRL